MDCYTHTHKPINYRYYESKLCYKYYILYNHIYRSVITTLENAINKNSTDAPTDAGWLYILPLLHFLREDSEPFKTSSSDKHRTDSWWGLEGVKKAKENIMKYSEGFYKYSWKFCEPREWNMYVVLVFWLLFLV